MIAIHSFFPFFRVLGIHYLGPPVGLVASAGVASLHGMIGLSKK